MNLRYEIPTKQDIPLLVAFYNQLSIDEGKWQFPDVSRKEMKDYTGSS